MSNSMELHGVLCRYLRDLQLRTFPDNDEGDHGLRWTNAEIKRVEQLVAAESSLAALNAELLEALEEVAGDLFLQIEPKHGAKAASQYPSFVKARSAAAKARSAS